jgi:hypothetical protein
VNTITIESKTFTFWGDNILGKNTIILISGKASIGKTTVGDFLEESLSEVPLNVTSIGFADDLKKVARNEFDWDGRKDSKGRKLLQQIGLIGREYNKNIWVEKLLGDLDSASIFFPDITIIDDWRFLNEAEYFEEGLYDLFKINIVSNIRGGLKGELGEDISETELNNYTDYDYIVENNFTNLEDLKKECEKLVDILIEEN